MIRRVLIVLGIVGVSLYLAFPLRDAVYAMIIVPAAYIFWAIGLAYHSVPQVIWWVGVTVIVMIILFRGLIPQGRIRKRPPAKVDKPVGQVETLSALITKTERGNYSKWIIANRLGKVAYQILSQRETGKQRSFFDPLTGPDWTADTRVQSYLESGFHGSFTDFPQTRKFFSPPKQTPLDQDVKEVVQYLESQLTQK